jgi:hypothetical protein
MFLAPTGSDLAPSPPPPPPKALFHHLTLSSTNFLNLHTSTPKMEAAFSSEALVYNQKAIVF